eukprot:4574974-Prymnesium_polylepis.1
MAGAAGKKHVSLYARCLFGRLANSYLCGHMMAKPNCGAGGDPGKPQVTPGMGRARGGAGFGHG